jgi:hypothetical protein
VAYGDNNLDSFSNQQQWDWMPWFSKYIIYWYCTDQGKIFLNDAFFTHKTLTTQEVIYYNFIKFKFTAI